MGHDGYAPMFKGQLPTDWQSRWMLIRQFVDFWCMDEDAPLADRSHAKTSLIEKAEHLREGDVSPSIRQWLSLAQEAMVRDSPHIRDCPIVEPIEQHFDDYVPIQEWLEDPVPEAETVILMQGERDIFWAVPNDRFGEDDPPVYIFQQFDQECQPFWGCYATVSEFTLSYVCTCNSHAKRSSETFTAFVDDEEMVNVREWFQYSLVVESQDRSYDGSRLRFFELLEKENIAAIVINTRVSVSVFCEPSEIDMPKVLREAMERHLKDREEFRSMCERVRDK